MKKLLLTLLVLLCLCPAALAETSAVTVMMYMCGTDLQEDCLTDVNEICQAQLSDDVRVVVLAGGTKKWSDKRLQGGHNNLFTIENGSYSTVSDWGKDSMGDPDTLYQFISYAAREYPADRSILILWDHGAGAASGICFDEVHNDDSLTLVELDSALQRAAKENPDFHLSIFGCDACMMAGYEIAAMASNYADYFIASEELEPWTGWYYTPWLTALTRDPGMDAIQIGRNIIDTYAEGVEREQASEYTTLSLIDLAALRNIQPQIEQLADYLSDALENGQLATIRRMIQRMYAYGSHFSKDSSWDMYDMGDWLNLCAQFAPTTAAQAQRGLADAVVYSYASSDIPVAAGLSIFLPNTLTSDFLTDYRDGYALSAYMPRYVNFVSGLSTMLSGSSYTFQAAAPSQTTVSDVSVSTGLTAWLFGFIPGSTYNAEATGISAAVTAPSQSTTQGAVPNFIPGNVNATPAPAQPAANVPGFIPGSVSPSVTIPPEVAAQVPGFIPGSINPAFVPPVASESSTDLAFSLTLSQDQMNNLSYAEGMLMLDCSDEDIYALLDLGYVRNSWIDWMTNTVYSTFDGTWPTLDGQLVTLYDLSSNAVSRRSLIPVKVNGRDTYLVVTFDAGSTSGRILGYNDGVDANGLPIRRTTPLMPGDEILPIYTLLCSDWGSDDDDLEELTLDGDPIIWRNGMEVIYDALSDYADGECGFAFCLNDIFGDYEISDFFPFTL